MSKIKNKSYLIRACKEIISIKPTALIIECASGVIPSLWPFVNVIMMAKIVEVLYTSISVNTLILYCGITVGLNFIFGLASRTLKSLGRSMFMRLHLEEQHKIDDVLYKMQYDKLENTEFDTLLRKYKENREKSAGQLAELFWLIQYAIKCVLTLAVSLYLIFPLLKFAFVKTGTSFAGSPYFILALVGVIAIAAIIIFIFQKSYNKLYVSLREEEFVISKTLNYYVDTLSDYKNGKEIRLFDMQELIHDSATTTLLTKGVALRIKIAKKLGANSAVTAIIGVVVAFGLYVFMALKGLAGAFEVSSLVLYLGSFMLVVESIMGFAGLFSSTGRIIKSLRYFFDIIDAAESQAVTEILPTKQVDSTDNFTIEFKNVSFKYDGASEYALKNVSVTINKGEKVAIVGQNGSGKTTFIKLISKFYKNYEGDILLNGVNIKEIDDDVYKKMFSIVFQDFKIFSLTVAQNVAASDVYDCEHMSEVLKKSDLLGYINKLENKCDTQIGKDFIKDGVDFSGGEAQKLAISRAFYKASECLILDEPTASLDPLAEAEFYNKFNNFAKDKTVFYISHRLSSCIFCERILVFNHGELEQSGSHVDLIKNADAKYYELWNTQAKYYL